MFCFKATSTCLWQTSICPAWLLASHRYVQSLLFSSFTNIILWRRHRLTNDHKNICIFFSVLCAAFDSGNKWKEKASKVLVGPDLYGWPMRASNSFVGIEEYVAPVGSLFLSLGCDYLTYLTSKECSDIYWLICHFSAKLKFCSTRNIYKKILLAADLWDYSSVREIITGAGHTSAVDWWALGNFYALSQIWNNFEII